jgi:hypothetical protein
MHSQPGLPRRGGGRRLGPEWRQPPDQAQSPGTRAEAVRQCLEAVRQRAQCATSWLQTSKDYARLINRDGVVPVKARFTADDLAFLATAREELLRFADLGMQLAELHQALDAAAISSEPGPQFPRCRSCMWRWPCPTFRILDAVLTAGKEET